jgi:signal transduction histidine kinase
VLERVRISTKLTILVAIPLASLVLLGLVAAQTLQQVRIGGDAYGRIVDRKDLVADVLPPPLFLVEADLEVHRLAAAVGDPDVAPDELSTRRETLNALETQYRARVGFWSGRLDPADTVGRALLADADRQAQLFWDGYHNRFLPVLDRAVAAAGDPVADGAALRQEVQVLDEAFAAHRVAVVELVARAEADLAAQEQAANDLTRSQALLLAGAGLAIIGIVAAAGLLVARSIARPIRALTDAANEAATSGLGELVETVRDLPAGAALPEIAPFVVSGGEEIARLSASFDSLRTTAVGLAAGEAQLRQNVSAMFVNLGRRNQNLLNRTLNFITTLEQNERSPEALDNLFRLDHLVTRMRRNAESLLVLAGTDAPRTWTEAVDIGDVVRGALSEIEAYDRIEITALEQVEVRGNAAADLAHLLAEVLENATTFSPPSADVSVIGMMCPDGYLLSVTDSGIGMTAREMEDANARLSEPTKFDSSPLMVLGLFVVSRLARRHGIAVVLTDSPSEGVTAKIRLPYELLENAPPLPLDSRQPALGPGEADVDHDGTEQDGTGHDTSGPDGSGPDADADGSPGEPAVDEPADEPVLIPTSRPELDGSVGRDIGLTRRRRGAQMPDTGPDGWAGQDVPDPDRTPEVVRSALSAFQGGQLYGRQIEPAAIPLTTDPPPATDVEAGHAEPLDMAGTGPVDAEPVDTEPADPGPADTEPVDPEPVDPEPVWTELVWTEPVEAPASGAQHTDPVPPPAPAPLARRVRGAHRFEPASGSATTVPDRSPDDVRSSLSSFQSGQARAGSAGANPIGEGEG